MLASDGSASDLFGMSVNVYVTTTMIGAGHDDDKATDAGTLIQY
jgi:hypothetical protein